MALLKQIKQANGVEVNYHRIAMVKIETNQITTILVYSYLNEDGRQYEKDYAECKIEGEPMWPYYTAEYKTFDYDENMSIKNAYEWLKQQPEFEGAEDV